MAGRRERALHRVASREATPFSGRASARGFTLIEIGVVILVVVILMGIAIPTLSSVSGAKARGEAAKLASNLRATRGHAAVAGETCRFVVCIENCGNPDRGSEQPDNSYYMECTKGTAAMTKETVRHGQMEEESPIAKDLEHMSDAEKAKAAILERTKYAPNPTLAIQQVSGLKIASVWSAHQSEKYTKGKAYLYFYPSGMSERANIQLVDGDDWYTIEVSPLSGKVKMVSGKVEPVEGREEED